MRTLVSVAAGFVLAAYPASAQSVSLADTLLTNASCFSTADARASLEGALAQAAPDTSQTAIVSALRDIAGRDDLCTELKDAARNFADQAVGESLVRADAPLPSTSSAIVAATLAEAERRAANLRFDVAPPPRFLTKERISRP